MSSTEHRISIVGIGSSFGADAIGLNIVDQLAAEHLQQDYPEISLEFVLCESPALLPGQIAGADTVILIDGMVSTTKPGTIHELSIEDLADEHSTTSSHAMDIVLAINLTRALDDFKLMILGVSVGADTESDTLDLALSRAYSVVLGKVLEQCSYCAIKNISPHRINELRPR